MFQCTAALSGQHIDLSNSVYLVSKKFHTHCRITVICRKNLQRISMHPEGSSSKVHLISCILYIYQRPDDIIPVFFHSRTQRYHHSHIVFRTSQTVNTGNASYHDDIFPLHQRGGRRQTQFIDFLVDRGIFCDISIRGRHICLRLIIIIIGNKIFHSVFRKEFFELPIQLCRQCLIMRDNQCRLIQCSYDICHRKCFSRTRNSQQGLELVALLKALHQCLNRLWLVTGWLIF